MPKVPSQPITEDLVVRALQERYGSRGGRVKMGIGDDAAVVWPRGAEEYWVITTDMLLEGTDFRRGWLTPKQLGYKALAANLSDLASMGAQPRFHTVALGIPASTTQEWILAFYEGLAGLGFRQSTMLVGGDLSRSNRGIHVTITAVGETLSRKPIYRSGGRAGDCLYVTGTLGKAAAGLQLLLRRRRSGKTAAERAALEAHRMPEPRCEVGRWLASRGFARCMIDLSDGLSTDLARLCDASRAGAELFLPEIPTFSEARDWRCNPVELALHGGEDFELLFAVSPRHSSRLERSYPSHYPRLSRIGRLTETPGLVLINEPGKDPERLSPRGYDHFRKNAV